MTLQNRSTRQPPNHILTFFLAHSQLDLGLSQSYLKWIFCWCRHSFACLVFSHIHLRIPVSSVFSKASSSLSNSRYRSVQFVGVSTHVSTRVCRNSKYSRAVPQGACPVVRRTFRRHGARCKRNGKHHAKCAPPCVGASVTTNTHPGAPRACGPETEVGRKRGRYNSACQKFRSKISKQIIKIWKRSEHCRPRNQTLKGGGEEKREKLYLQARAYQQNSVDLLHLC